MRGHDEQTTHMFSYLSPEQRVPADHPLRAVRALTDEALQTMSRRFASLYATTGRPSIPPEQLLRVLLLQVLYTVRSERLLMEELNDNLLFRWFVGLNMDDPVWHPTTFTKNRDRLLSGDVAAAFFDAVQAHARAAGLLSDEHFTVDGTQLEAWASLKSFRCVDEALQTMSRRFASLYATTGRPSIPPEQWLRALLLQVLYTVRSERLLMEELNDNLLFRWFVGLNMDDPVWHPTTFTKNRDRLLSGDVAAAFFDAVQAHARAA